MRRAELIDAVQQVVNALNESDLDSVITNILRVDRTGGPLDEKYLVPLLDALLVFSAHAQKYDLNAKKVAEIVDLKKLENAGYWSKLLSAENRRPHLLELRETVRFASKYLPTLVDLVQPESFRMIQESAEGIKSKYAGKSVLTVIILEEGNRFSSPARLTKVLDGTAMLYEACAIIEDLPPESLSVIACDSGSDKSFDFLGVAKIIECVTNIVLSLWDRVIFFRERQLAERLDLIAGSLPIINEIGNLERENKLGPEQAEILRRKILDGVGKFIEAGAIIPEIEKRSVFNPRLLMSPEPKLLASAPDADSQEHTDQDTEKETVSETKESKDSELNSLTDNERSELLRLLRKVQDKDEQESQDIAEEPDEG